MVKRLILSFPLLLSSCGNFDAHTSSVYIDYAFENMVLEYQKTKKQYLGTSETKAISIYFKSLRQDGFEGMCTRETDGKLSITIDPVSWFYGSIWDKRALFYHEMGHCDLAIWDHTDEITIMNSHGIWGTELK